MGPFLERSYSVDVVSTFRKVTKGVSPSIMRVKYIFFPIISTGLCLVNMRMDSVLCDFCVTLIRGPIWSHLFINFATQDLVISALVFLSSLFLLDFSPPPKSLFLLFTICAKP